jgi:hypothetical protein
MLVAGKKKIGDVPVINNAIEGSLAAVRHLLTADPCKLPLKQLVSYRKKYRAVHARHDAQNVRHRSHDRHIIGVSNRVNQLLSKNMEVRVRKLQRETAKGNAQIDSSSFAPLPGAYVWGRF